MLPHQVKHHQIVLLRGLHILVEIIDQLHIVGERGVVARRVRQACDFGIVDEGVDGDGVEPLRHVGALHVPHPHIIAAVLEDGGEIRVVEPVFAIAHAVDAKGVFLHHRGHILLRHHIGEGKQIASRLLTLHTGRGERVVAVEAGVVLVVTFAKHIYHRERVGVLNHRGGFIHLFGLLDGKLHIIVEGTERIDGVQTLRPRVERIVGEIVSPNVDLSRIAAAQQPHIAHRHQHNAHRGVETGEPSEETLIQLSAQKNGDGASLPFAHANRHQHHKVEKITQLAGVGEHIGVNKLRTLFRIRLHEHRERLLRNAHLKVECQKQRDAHQCPEQHVEQCLHRNFRPLSLHPINEASGKIHHGKLDAQSLHKLQRLLHTVVENIAHPMDGLLNAHQKREHKKHRLSLHRRGHRPHPSRNMSLKILHLFPKFAHKITKKMQHIRN